MPAPEESDLDILLAHAGWCRALARSLVRDSHRADDLVQQTWLAALEHPPEGTAPIRRWLASVMRNFARQDARAEKRRGRREERGARHEALPAPDALEEEAELQRSLLEAVRALEEPYRSTIWARYYEGLAPRAIAARDGLAVKTVKTRLHRGLNELRLRLDRDHGGDRRAWLAALMPLAKPPSLSATTWGALLVSTEVKIAGGLVAVVAAVALWRSSIDSSSIESSLAPDSAPAAPAVKSERRHEPALEAPEVEGSRVPRQTTQHASKAAAAAAIERLVAHGRVLDLERRPVAGVAIAVRTPSSSKAAPESERVLDVVSSHDGSFELPWPQAGVELGVHSDAWVHVYAARLWGEKPPAEVTIFVAPRRPLAGMVVDGERRGIAHADVEIILDAGLRRDLGAVLDANLALGWRARTDEQGHFELNDAPLAPSEVSVRAVGWIPRRIEPPTRPTYDLEIALAPVEESHAFVRGRVVDAERRPVEGAYVALGSETHTSRADGAFEFDLDAMKELDVAESTGNGAFAWKHDVRSIVAAKPGHLPARAAIPAAEELRRGPTPHAVELVLGARPLEIRGRVVDADGNAVPNAVVRSQGETPFGTISQKTDTAEIAWKTSVESLLRGGSRRLDTVSAADGSFAITGLLDKEYGLVALDRRTLRLTAVEKVRAGSSDVLITLPPEKDCVRVAGRVVSPGGDPIPGVRVNVGRGWKADQDLYGNMFFGASVETDERGHFEFPKIASTDVTFQVSSQSIFIVLSWTPKPEDRLDDLSITVSRRCHVQIDLGARKDLADRATALDEKGRPSNLLAVHGDVMWGPGQFSIENGRSEALACEETARTIVLYSRGREVQRVPFTPKPGELVVVRP